MASSCITCRAIERRDGIEFQDRCREHVHGLRRFRRHCYDKPWRCPGWAGGGWTYPSARRDVCDGGSFATTWGRMLGGQWYADRWINWRWHHCQACGTIAIPHVTRWLDPTWWRWLITWKIRSWRD